MFPVPTLNVCNIFVSCGASVFRSLLNTRCRICRRKTDPEKMLLCDKCDRGHHMYCLKPKLKAVPEGDWFCNECKPKERLRSPKKKSRRVFSTAEDEDDEERSGESEGETENGAEDSEEEENSGAEDDDDGGEDDSRVNSDDSDRSEADSEDEDDLPHRKGKRGRASRNELLKKKSKKGGAASAESGSGAGSKRKSGGLQMLLGKRRCAAEASEKIARVALEANSGHSSGSESNPECAAAAAPRTTRSGRVSKPVQEEAPVSNGHHAGERSAAGGGTGRDAAGGGGSKNGTGGGGGSRSKRRRAVDVDIYSMFNPTMLEDLLNAMMKHRDGWPFDRPITKTDAPDYHKIVKRPMDLGTIRSNIMRMKYTCNSEVIEDIKLVFDNCRLYNKEDAEEFQCGERLERYFKKEARKLKLMLSEEDEENGFEDEETEVAVGPKKKRSRRTF